MIAVVAADNASQRLCVEGHHYGTIVLLNLLKVHDQPSITHIGCQSQSSSAQQDPHPPVQARPSVWACEKIKPVRLPRFQPMPLAVLREPFDHPDWLFEIKYDGFRALAYIEHGSVRLVSRKGNVYKSFDNLCGKIAESVRVQNAILDGEIVHLDAVGKPLFYSLVRRRSPQQFVAFDVLWLNGKDLRQTPLSERKRILRSVVPVGSTTVLFADHIDANGTELFRAVCDQDLEGIVAKRRDGLYTPGETTWVKIKNPRYSQMDGRRELFERRRSAVA